MLVHSNVYSVVAHNTCIFLCHDRCIVVPRAVKDSQRFSASAASRRCLSHSCMSVNYVNIFTSAALKLMFSSLFHYGKLNVLKIVGNKASSISHRTRNKSYSSARGSINCLLHLFFCSSNATIPFFDKLSNWNNLFIMAKKYTNQGTP